MDVLHAMTVFVAVAEEEGFASAGRKLNMSPPAVTRSIAALEKYLGTPLLIRTTRRVRLTATGQQYLHDAKRILADVKLSQESAAGAHGRPTGHLSVTAPAMFGRLYITPVITEFLERNPDVSVTSVLVDRVTNLIDEGIDVGIRIGELPDSSLRSIRLGSVRIKTYASPSYLAQFGTPQTPEELVNHRLIASTAGSRSPTWKFYGDDNNEKGFSLKLSPSYSSNTNDSVIAATAQGFGITRVLSYQAAAEVEAGKLVAILEEFDGPPMPISVVHPQGRNVPAKVRVFMDLAIELLGKQLF
ncbi:LysR family transcriptional regulator [Aurantivibrio plasticivorans]